MTKKRVMQHTTNPTRSSTAQHDRRTVVGAGLALSLAGCVGLMTPANAQDAAAGKTTEAAGAASDKYTKTMQEFLGGAEPKMEKVTLTAPEIAENGNTVPIGVAVDSPMTEDNHVVSILILADGNPEPGVAKLNFSKYSAEAMARTRIRLAKTQNITAIAKMSDGSFYADKKYVKVTIGGCGG